ncbi:MAG: spermidine synthase [Candidatus Bipolaricaulota bacterium]|nr:MAG: spermidine synthase [Candidatus Bipolaricaulota bacterium]
MSSLFEQIDCRQTPLGEIVLRRRRLLGLGGIDVYEVKLDEEFLMSSLFHEAEVALATIVLGRLGRLGGEAWDVVVGGLGLGYTALAVLEFPQVQRLVVIEALEAVIDWHVQRLVPNGVRLTADARCIFHRGDFFALTRDEGFDPEGPGHRFDAVLLDIDHSPDHHLHPSHAGFYTEEGLRRLRRSVAPGGVFGLWSNDPPQEGFMERLSRVFSGVEGHRITFPNPLQNAVSSAGIYIARRAPES